MKNRTKSNTTCNQAQKRHKLLHSIVDHLDGNGFSFISGMLANIPVSLLFMFQKWGDNNYAHSFYILHIITIVLSTVLVAIGVALTITRINISKDATSGYENWLSEKQSERFNEAGETATKKRAEFSNSAFDKHIHDFRLRAILFLIFSVIVLATVVTLWALYFLM